MKLSHFTALLQPHIDENLTLKDTTFEAITVLGLQCRLLNELLEMERPIFAYENCSFCIYEGYYSVDSLAKNGLKKGKKP